MGARVRRREFIGLLGGATALAAPRWASAQSTPRRLRLGWLNATDTFKEPQNVAFVQRLGELGFVEGVSLDWLLRRDLERDEVRGLLIAALGGALAAALAADPSLDVDPGVVT